MNTCTYHVTDRGLRKVAARNGCSVTKTADGWDVFDSETNSLVDYSLTATQVLALFN
jgi:hypothetical protein